MTKCRVLVIALLALVVAIGGIIYFCNRRPVFHGDYQLFSSKGRPIAKIEILSDKQQQYQGFSRQVEPCPACGLLFIWPVLLQPTIVMRKMTFALDLVWLRDQQIVQFTENAAPEGKKPKVDYQPNQPVDAVLEVPAGFIHRHNLQVGQSLTWR